MKIFWGEEGGVLRILYLNRGSMKIKIRKPQGGL